MAIPQSFQKSFETTGRQDVDMIGPVAMELQGTDDMRYAERIHRVGRHHSVGGNEKTVSTHG